MVLKRMLSLSLLLALAGGAFVASEQNAEAGRRCCRQRCHRRCNSGCGYAYAYSGNCNTCTTQGNPGQGMNQGTYYDGNAPGPAAPAAPAPPPST